MSNPKQFGTVNVYQGGIMANIFGTNGDDNLNGSATADTIFTRAGSDVVQAGDGDDVIIVDPGNGLSASSADILDGGTGFDTVSLSGNMADYDVSFDVSGNVVLTGKVGTAVEGDVETLISIESVVFDDQVMRIVDASGSSGAFTTIQSAVDISDAGDAVVVLGGTYNETVTVDTGISLIGEGSDEVTIGGGGYGIHVTGDIDNGGAATVSIDGFGFDGNSVGVRIASSTQLSSLLINNSDFSNNATHGIGSGSGAFDLAAISVTNSTFANNGTGGGNGAGHIVLFGFIGDATLTDLVIDGTTAPGTPVGGLPDNAIQIAGFMPGTYDVENPLGTVILENITATGDYHKPLVMVQGYTNLSTLTATNVNLNGSSTWGPLLFIDPVASSGGDAPGAAGYPGFFDGQGGTNTLDLSGFNLTDTGTADAVVFVRGTDANDVITGTAGDDILNAPAEGPTDMGGDDTVDGGAGDDLLIGGIGDDDLEGGSGTDTAQFSGERSDFTITQNPDGSYSITDNNAGDGDEGTDALNGIEQLMFGTDTFAYELDSNSPDFTSAIARFSQSFDADTAGFDGENEGWSGSMTIVASGTGGIASTDGSTHAVFAQTNAGGGLTGPFSRFDGYRDNLGAGFRTSFDVYLDPASMAAGEGFDVSVAANNQSGGHLQDFIFHVTNDTSTGGILIGGSNNTNFDPREDLENQNHYAVTAAGWYTMEWEFYENADGILEVAMNVYDGAGNWVFTEIRSDPANDFDTVYGGNRYMWFTNIDVANGIAVDNFTMSTLDTGPVQVINGNNVLSSHATIADAVAAAATGDTIDIPAGDYAGEGNVLVTVDGLIFRGPAGAVNVSLLLDAGVLTATAEGAADFAIAGGADDNTLTGASGNDTLDGGAGDDIMAGGVGDDVYYVDSVLDVVTELAGEGIDHVMSSLASYTLGDFIENGTTTALGNSLLIGNSLDNTLTATNGATLQGRGGDDTLMGSDDDDRLIGGGGNDLMMGGEGNDKYLVATAGDMIVDTGSSDQDLVISPRVDIDLNDFTGVEWGRLTGSLDLNITGDAGDNRLFGNSGENEVTGGLGADILIGGAGNDRFVFNSTDDSTLANLDRIIDFEQGTVAGPGDLIDLLNIDSIEGGRNNAFTFIGTDAFSNTAGELRYTFVGANTHVQADTDGDGVADFELRIMGNFALEDADFIL